jgi:hypothetical protein
MHRPMKRSELFKLLALVLKKIEKIELTMARNSEDRKRIAELEEKLFKLERRHEALLARYNELEVRWPTLGKR